MSQMNIYQESGYLDIRKLYKTLTSMGVYFLFMIGGRGTGKTYGTLEMVIEDHIKFFLIRRMQSEADMINIPKFSPFKKLNEDKEWHVEPRKLSKNNSGIYYKSKLESEESEELVGYTGALSTISSMRGFDASDVNILVYDEFIKESHARPIKNEATALFNAIETMNRNRELEGLDPMFIICLANSNELANDLFINLKVVGKLVKMRDKGNEVYINRKRSLCIIDVQESEISEKKKETVLYKLTEGTDFYNMSLNNDFNEEDHSRIVSRPIREYRPIVMVGELVIYVHKHRNVYYASTHKSGNMPCYGFGDVERSRFIRAYHWIFAEFMEDNIEFENKTCEILFTKAFK